MGIEIRKAHSTELTREELYELVWSMPMTKVGKQLEISDVAVRKICVKYNIPRPPQGYWASERRRRQVRPVLPKADQYASIIRIHVPERASAPLEPEIPLPDAVEKVIAKGVPLRLGHRLGATSQELKRGETDKYGFLRPRYGVAVHEVIATKASLSRALHLMEFVFQVCAASGMAIEIPETSHSRLIMNTLIGIGDNKIALRIKSEVSRVNAPVDPKGWGDKYAFDDSGRLSLTVDGKKVFREATGVPLEQNIGEIYRHIVSALKISEERRRLAAIERRKSEVASRRRLIDAALAELEEKRLTNFDAFKADTERKLDYECFVAAMESREELDALKGWNDWIKWARQATVLPLEALAKHYLARDAELTSGLKNLAELDPEDDGIDNALIRMNVSRGYY
ncbi:hypothetical protein HNQ57_002611 [Zhongshania antarctica]|uniref:Uncharacterized protein n=1 Tax=Zhongshania antarctica TaxID=641702 RepID=A0A840R7G0_9GAMM|nr:hypothetical protein [Zhongshania antarctica]MBB5188332.1 hypothetical protein [Zhongshania antarctica]